MKPFEKAIHAEYRRLLKWLTPGGAITRLASAYHLRRRTVISILGPDTVGDEIWHEYRMDQYQCRKPRHTSKTSSTGHSTGSTSAKASTQ